MFSPSQRPYYSLTHSFIQSCLFQYPPLSPSSPSPPHPIHQSLPEPPFLFPFLTDFLIPFILLLLHTSLSTYPLFIPIPFLTPSHSPSCPLPVSPMCTIISHLHLHFQPDLVQCKIFEFDHLIAKAKLGEDENFQDFLNPVTKTEVRTLNSTESFWFYFCFELLIFHFMYSWVTSVWAITSPVYLYLYLFHWLLSAIARIWPVTYLPNSSD